MLRVLLITRELWRDDSNEGSVLSSWFNGQPMEFAQIYCKPGTPTSKCCKRFFQLTDKMAVKNILKGEPMGTVVEVSAETPDVQNHSEQEKKSFYDFFRRHNFASFYLAQECLWKLANWKSKALEEFVDDFAPDVIFAPLTYSRYVMAIQRWVAKRLKKPVAGVIWDDLYSLNQWSISPIFWLHRLIQRHSIGKTAKICDKMYTLSPQQAEAFGKQFNRTLGVFPKVGEITESPFPSLDSDVRFIYAGGIYFGRLETLTMVAETLAKLNQEGYRCQLDVYTNSPGVESLEKYDVCKVHAAVSADALKALYDHSHVALHVEGFERAIAKRFQLSFSSKIVDCLSSGCAVLAVCPETNCGFRYLMEQDAALCIDNRDDIASAVASLVKNPENIKSWAEKAKKCASARHESSRVRTLIKEELESLAEGRNK